MTTQPDIVLDADELIAPTREEEGKEYVEQHREHYCKAPFSRVHRTIDLSNPDDLNDPDENYEWMDPENRAELRSMYPDFDVEQRIDRADQ